MNNTSKWSGWNKRVPIPIICPNCEAVFSLRKKRKCPRCKVTLLCNNEYYFPAIYKPDITYIWINKNWERVDTIPFFNKKIKNKQEKTK